ncbi:apoptotic chromatin condensation inducer in the nucleus-like isoform X1 [Tachypleus tridentatus]|uniref:apoptotic chromatin condensation inducer in the nucleus-like isoform X1 n=1 Tax=Tachypleus tridentatus TaxID=6853 RepID=UPI003FD06A64
MADKSEISLNGKPISTLRVVDLKQELEKRGLSKSGSKKDLVDRLKLQLQIERLHNSSEKSEVEPSDRSADLVPNISLQDDVIAEQNDFIKKYLADQQKSYAIQKEARRLVELENYRSSDAEASSSQEEEGSPEKDDNKRKGKLNEEHIKVGEEIAVDQLGMFLLLKKKSVEGLELHLTKRTRILRKR